MRLRLSAALIVALASPAAMAQVTGGVPAPAPAPAPGQQQRPANPAFAAVEDVPDLPRVLLLGDSISIGYTLDVREALAGKANVHRPAENCGPTTRGLERIDAWLGDGDWDVIHVNFGLHDLKFVDDAGRNASPEAGRHQVSLEDYERNLDRIFSRLKETGATVIFATTTPVPPGEPQRKAGDEFVYNEVARKVAGRHEVLINDLYGFIAPRFEAVAIRPGNVHFSPEGSDLLGNRVADEIEEALRARQ